MNFLGGERDNTSKNKAYVLYNAYVKKYKKKYKVKGTTWATDLGRIGKDIFKDKWLGVFAQDTVPSSYLNEAYGIVNVDTSNKKGSHWVAIYKKGKTIYIYDSFNRESKTLLPVLIRQLHSTGRRYVDSNKLDAEQVITQRNCGLRCIAWLSVVRDLGITQARKI